MAKFKLSILLALLTLTVAISRATDTTNYLTENVPITLIAGTQQSGEDRSSCMLVSIDGQILTITFTEPLGRVTIIIEDASGTPVEFASGDTPNGYMYYITTPGTYTLRIVLSDGDEYSARIMGE